MNYIIVNSTFTEQLSKENGIEGIKRTQEKRPFSFFWLKTAIINMKTTSHSVIAIFYMKWIYYVYLYIYLFLTYIMSYRFIYVTRTTTHWVVE